MSQQALTSHDRDMLSMIRRYQRVCRAARKLVILDIFSDPTKKRAARGELLKALDVVYRRHGKVTR